MTNPLFLLAPAGGMEFIAMPSGAVYVANAAGLITIANGAAADQQALIAQGCTALLPNTGGTTTTEPGTAYTVQNGDQNNAIVFTASSAVTITLPNAMPQGFAVELFQGGSGVVSAGAGSGASLVTPNQSQTLQQYGSLLCMVIANTNGANAVWDVVASPTTTGSGLVGAATLTSLYAQDSSAHYAQYSVAQVLSDPTSANNGIWLKTGSGNGSGNWTQESTLTLAGINVQVTANASAVASLQAAVGGTQQIGPATVGTVGGWTSGSSLSMFNASPATISASIASLSIAAETAQTAYILVANLNTDGTLSLVSSTAVALGAGVNTILNPGIAVAVGQYVGIEAVDIYQSGSGLTVWFASGAISNHTAISSISNYGLEMQVVLSSGLVPEVATFSSSMSSVQSTLGGAQSIGPAPVASGSSSSGTSLSMFNAVAATVTGTVDYFGVASVIAQNADIVVAELNSDGTFTLVSSTAITLAAGVNSFYNTGIAVAVGQYVGIQAEEIYKSGSGLTLWFAVGAISSHTSLTVETGWGMQLQVVIGGGLIGASLAEGGLGSLLAIDPTGVTDATSAFTQARNALSSLVFVPPGNFSLTSWPGEGDGFYGPGIVSVSGTQHPIFSQPKPRSLWGSLRAALQTVLLNGGSLCLIGDSITQGYGCSAITNQWAYRLAAFLNFYTSPGDLMSFVDFDNPGPANGAPSFYGVTLPASPTIGTNGPTGKSIILSSGQSITFTGTYAYVDVFYTQQSGAGSLAFAFNSGSGYKTVSCAGSTVLDKCTYPSATGQSGNGTYSITASGGSVEITGLLRLAPSVSILPESPPRIPVMNFSHGGYSISTFTSGMLASMLAQAGFAGGTRHAAIINLGENDQASILPATMYTNLSNMIATLKSGGMKDIWGCGITRPGNGAYSYSTGCNYDGANAAVRAAYRDAGIPIIPLDAVDWAGLGLLADGIHPNNAGQLKYLQIACEGLAA